MDKRKCKMKKTLIITSGLEYDPLREYSRSGSCKMKCPLGECTLEIILQNNLRNVIQIIDLKTEEIA